MRLSPGWLDTVTALPATLTSYWIGRMSTPRKPRRPIASCTVAVPIGASASTTSTAARSIVRTTTCRLRASGRSRCGLLDDEPREHAPDVATWKTCLLGPRRRVRSKVDVDLSCRRSSCRCRDRCRGRRRPSPIRRGCWRPAPRRRSRSIPRWWYTQVSRRCSSASPSRVTNRLDLDAAMPLNRPQWYGTAPPPWGMIHRRPRESRNEPRAERLHECGGVGAPDSASPW